MNPATRLALILVGALALAMAAWLLWSDSGSGPEPVRGPDLPAESPERERPDADLTAPAVLPERDSTGEVVEESPTRTPDVVERAKWRLTLSLEGIALTPETPVTVLVRPLGSDDTRFEAPVLIHETTKDFTEAELNLDTIVIAQEFSPPTIRITVDHPDYYEFEELFEGKADSDGVVQFAAHIRLSPLTTLLAGRVVAPIEVEGPLSVAIYPLDEKTRAPEYQYLHQEECNELGDFSCRIPFPGDVVVVGHAPGTRPTTLELNLVPGTTQTALTLSLERGLELRGRATYLGNALTPNQRLFARAVNAPRMTWICGPESLVWEAERRRFYVHSPGVVQSDGAEFVITGLEDRDYDLMLYNSSSQSRLFFDPKSAQRVRPPAAGLELEFNEEL